MVKTGNINLVDFDFECVAVEAMKNKVDRIAKLKRKYSDGKILKVDLEEAHNLLNEGFENYIDIDLMTDENREMIEYGVENFSKESIFLFSSIIDGLTVHNEDIFIYLTIKTDDEDYIVEITEKYLFSASLINEAIKNTKGEKAYYRHLETGGQIYE